MKTSLIRAIIYARFSPRPVKYDTDGKAIDVDSIPLQLERCREYCRRRGYSVQLEETDPFTSGGVLGEIKRPGLHRALEALKPGWVLVCLSADRLAKGLLVEETIYAALEEARAIVDFVETGIPDCSPEGMLGRRCLGAAIEYARVKNNHKTSDGMRHLQANGRRVCGTKHLPYGWALAVDGPKIIGQRGVARPANMVQVPEEQAVIAKILAWAAEGKRPPTIAKLLREQSILCRGRAKWNRTLIARIIARGNA